MIKIKDVMFLACRFLALYILYNVLITFSSIVSYAVFSDNFFSETGKQITMTMFFITNIFLFFWIGAEWLAEKVSGKRADLEVKTDFKLEDIQNVGFVIAGMLVLMNSIPVFIKMTAISLMIEKISLTLLIVNIIQPLIHLILGISLILGAKWFSKIIKKFRKW